MSQISSQAGSIRHESNLNAPWAANSVTRRSEMQIEVLLFAAARDAAGSDAIQIDVDDDAQASDVIAAVGQHLPELSGLLPSCRLAVDCCYVSDDVAVSADSEIALIPPVSGG
jgi:molybdopterin converting factor subunit 1